MVPALMAGMAWDSRDSYVGFSTGITSEKLVFTLDSSNGVDLEEISAISVVKSHK